MERCCIETPLGYVKIVGNQDGITSVSIVDTTENISESIPESLLDCVTQLKAYFNNELKTFELKLNPEGTDFQNSRYIHTPKNWMRETAGIPAMRRKRRTTPDSRK